MIAKTNLAMQLYQVLPNFLNGIKLCNLAWNALEENN